jgi:serine/threonine protein phosphatase PrpC
MMNVVICNSNKTIDRYLLNRCSGATCFLVIIYNGKLSVYNCGDSRAVLGRKNPNWSMAPVALSKE